MMFSLVSGLAGLFGKTEKHEYDIASIYLDLRSRVLKLEKEDCGDIGDRKVIAVLMDTGYLEAAVTLVSVFDGSASLYFSNGGGTIGSGKHENVKSASQKLVTLSEKYFKRMKEVKEYPIASPDYTTFYVVTTEGVFTYTTKEADLGEGKDEFSPLFYQAHEVIGQIRFAEEKMRSEQGNGGNA